MPYFVLLVVALVLYPSYLTIYRLLYHPLARFPGPKLAAATWWYEFYFEVVLHGQYYKEIERLHSIYGPIVRINPSEVHVKDPDWYDELYAAGGRKRNKSDWYNARSGGESVFSTVGHDHHRVRRTALNQYFSKASIVKLEDMIQDKVDRLADAFQESMVKGESIETHTAFIALTLDVISHYAFGKSFGLLEIRGFSPEWKHNLLGAVESGIIARYLPWMVDILVKMPLWLAVWMNPAVGFFATLQDVIETQVIATLAANDESEASKHRTIFQELRDSNLPPQEKSVARLIDEGVILIGAGGDTTAHTLAALTFYVLDNLPALKKLTDELYDAIPDPRHLPKWQKLEQLPYLRATILETHRIQALITGRLIRVAPNDTLQFKQWAIPAGTPVSMSTHFTHRDPILFPEPMRFDPDRWFGAAKGMEKYVVPFSKGTRGCIGQHLATAQIYLATATLFRKFELELHDTTYRDVEIVWDGFAGGLRKDSKGINVKVKKGLV